MPTPKQLFLLSVLFIWGAAAFMVYQQLAYPLPVADWCCHCLSDQCRCVCVHCEHPLPDCSCGIPIRRLSLPPSQPSPTSPLDW